MDLSIASWNLNHWQRRPEERAAAWEYLRDVVAPDVALVQEAVPPEELTSVVYCPFPSPYRNWGTAVVALNPALQITPLRRREVTPYLEPGDLEDSQPGTSAVAEILCPDGGRFVAISVYGAIEKSGNGTGYATTTMHRVLSDLTSILDSYREPRPVVLGGDLNCSTQLEGPDRAAEHALFARLEAFGLTDCFAESADGRKRLTDCFCVDAGECSHYRTLRHKNDASSRPWHIDYMFSHHLDRAATRLTVIDEPAAWALSDHAPIMLTTRIGKSDARTMMGPDDQRTAPRTGRFRE